VPGLTHRREIIKALRGDFGEQKRFGCPHGKMTKIKQQNSKKRSKDKTKRSAFIFDIYDFFGI
jgi:hypothetical protein